MAGVFSGLTERLSPLRQQLLKPLIRSRVALSVAHDQLTLLTHRTAGGCLELESWQQVPLPPDLLHMGVPQQPEALGDLIGDLLLQGGIQAPGATALVPAPAVVLRLLDLPAGLAAAGGDAEDLLSWLQPHEAALELPFPLEQASLNLQRRGSRWLAAFTAQDCLDRWIDAVAIAGLELYGLEPEALAVERLLPRALADQPADQWCGCLDLQGPSWQLMLWQGDAPQLQCSIDSSNGVEGLFPYLTESGILPSPLWLLADLAEAPPPLERWGEQLGCSLELLDPLALAQLRVEGALATPPPAAVDRLVGLALGRLKP